MALTVTQVGLNKAVQASQGGISLQITHVGLGTQGYVPNKNMTALKNEVARVLIAGGENVASDQVHLTALFDGDEEITAYEIGFYLSDGTLFAVDSDPDNVLVYKHSTAKVVEAFDLILDAVPPDSITVNTSGDLSLYYAESFAVMAVAQINNMRRSITSFISNAL